MAWLAGTAERRGSTLGAVARRAFGHHARVELRTGRATRWRCCRRRSHGSDRSTPKGDDYHDLIKARLKELARWLVANAGGDVKVFVDTAAVMEKPLAASAGLGWQGKHTNLVLAQYGSWLFLGAIFTTLDLPADAPSEDIAAPAAPVSTSARPRPSPNHTGSMRAAAFRISPSSTRARSRATYAR